MRRFRTRPEEIYAERFDARSRWQMEQFRIEVVDAPVARDDATGETVVATRYFVINVGRNAPVMVMPGEWIIAHGDGRVTTMSDAEFHKCYRPLD